MSKPKRSDNGKSDGAASTIERGVVYPLDEFKRRTRLGDFAMRQMRRKGFPVRQVGCRRFVLGDDWIKWLSNRNDDDA